MKLKKITRRIAAIRGKTVLLGNIFLILLLILAPTLLISRYFTLQNQKAMEAEIVSYENIDQDRTSVLTLNFFRQAKYIAAYFSNKTISPSVFNVERYDIFAYNSLKAEMNSHLLIDEHIFAIHIKKNGYMLSTEDGDDIDPFYLTETSASLKEIKKWGNIQVLYRKRTDKYPVFVTFCASLIDGNDGNKVFVDIDTMRIGNTLFGNEVDDNKYSMIVNNDGDIIVTNRSSLIGNNINNIIDFSDEMPQKKLATAIYNEKEYYVFTRKIDDFDLKIINLTSVDSYSMQQDTINISILKMNLLMLTVVIILTSVITFKTYLPLKKILIEFRRYDILPKNSTEYSDEVKLITACLKSTAATNVQLSSQLKQRLDMLKKAHATALQAQINPHFINNTLDAINWISVDLLKGPNQISSGLVSLSKIMQCSMDTENMLHTLNDEIRVTKDYINLLLMRYQDTFAVEWDISVDQLDVSMLKFCIQPLIENAVTHGLRNLDREGILKINIKSINERLFIQVSDNGVGIEENLLAQIRSSLENDTMFFGNHIGIRNVNLRIRLLYGDDYGVEITSQPKIGTVTTVTIPLPNDGINKLGES